MLSYTAADVQATERCAAVHPSRNRGACVPIAFDHSSEDLHLD